ncbi:MAG: cupin domain-containing protein [Firmicutes bacterium]|nr:cupin domain-containing protein [Bacillota bacterium]
MSILRRKEEREAFTMERKFGGPGTIKGLRVINSDPELMDKGRIFSEFVLEKDCGFGYHVHDTDFEVYLMLEGEAEYSDNGSLTTLLPGDVAIVYPGEGHSITNLKDEPVRFVAAVLYQ